MSSAKEEQIAWDAFAAAALGAVIVAETASVDALPGAWGAAEAARRYADQMMVQRQASRSDPDSGKVTP